MFSGHFYNRRVVKATAVFGSLFNEIRIVQRDGSGSWNQMRVPLSYGPKRKFLERIAQMEDGEDAERRLAIKLPRMSFEMTNFAYDPNRQLPKTNHYKRASTDPERMGKFYVGTPYILSWQLAVYGKRQDDCLQVVEQILPYFNPEYSINIKPYDGIDSISDDVMITLTGVNISDDYEGAMEDRRAIVYTLDFDMKVNFYGPKPESGSEDKIIRKVKTALRHYEARTSGNDSDGFIEGLLVEPDPINVSPDSDFSLLFTVYDSA